MRKNLVNRFEENNQTQRLFVNKIVTEKGITINGTCNAKNTSTHSTSGLKQIRTLVNKISPFGGAVGKSLPKTSLTRNRPPS